MFLQLGLYALILFGFLNCTALFIHTYNTHSHCFSVLFEFRDFGESIALTGIDCSS
jgi:hypothetical protein